MSLARRSITSSAYNVASHALQIVILFFRSVMLARLLPPEVFGAYAYAQAIVVTTRALPVFGMGSAYIHRSQETEEPDALAVYLTLITTLTLLWAILLACAGVLWMDPQHQKVLWVLVATTFGLHLVAPAESALGRQVLFARLSILDLTRAAISTLVALLLASRGAGVWSLLSIDIVGIVVLILGLYVIRPVWRPRFAWSPRIARYFVNFGSKSLVAGLLGQAIDRIDDLWTGSFLGDAALGLYSRAYTFANYPRRVVASPVNSVAMATYAELKDDRKRLSQSFFRVNALVVRLSYLFAGILYLVAPEFVRHVLGAHWTPMINAFRLMLAYTAIDPIKGTVGHLFLATGAPQNLARTRLAQLAILVLGLVTLGPLMGIEGVALAATLMAVLGMGALLWQARALVDYSPLRLFLTPTAALALGAVLAFAGTELAPIGSDVLRALAKASLFCIGYVPVLAIAEREQVIDLLRMASAALRRPAPPASS